MVVRIDQLNALFAVMKPVEYDSKKARELAQQVDVVKSKYWEEFKDDAESNLVEFLKAKTDYAQNIGFRLKEDEDEDEVPEADRPDPVAFNQWDEATETLGEEYETIQFDTRDLLVRLSEITGKVPDGERDQYAKEEMELIKKRDLSVKERINAACKKYFPTKNVQFPDDATIPSDLEPFAKQSD